MSEHTAQVDWQRRPDEPFTDQCYQRRHVLRFDGGAEVPGSSAPTSVPRHSDPAAVDPEEMFVASLASCHMLWFLSLAAHDGHVVDRYVDDALGTLARNAAGRLVITRVVLRPQVRFRDRPLTAAELQDLHHRAHEACFIAQSVTSEVLCEPRLEPIAP